MKRLPIEDPSRLRDRHDEPGIAGDACRDLDSIARACSAYVESPRGRAATYWALRGHAARRAAAPTSRGRRLGAAAVIGACCALAAAIVIPRLRSAPTAAEILASSSASTGDLVPARSAAGHRGPPSARSNAEPWTRLDLGEVGTLEASPLTRVEIEDVDHEHRIHVRSGTLRAQILRQDPFQPLVVVTPHLRILVVGTRFDVRTDAHTVVDLFDGAVQVESGEASLLLRAGESIRSDDPRLAPPAPATPHAAAEPAAPAPTRRRAVAATVSIANCESIASAEARRRCFERIAEGSDLAAETALLQLAARAADDPASAELALVRLRQYAARFPNGVFGADAAMRELEVLSGLGRLDAVAASAEAFQRRFPSDPRAPEVAVARASALCRLPGRRAEAVRVLAALGVDAGPEVLKAAHALRSRCGSEAPPADADGPPPAPATAPPAD